MISFTRTTREARTADGDVVTLDVRSSEADAVVNIIKEHVVSIRLPRDERLTRRSAYGQYSRYHIIQHEYAGGGHPGDGGFIETLEIQDAPEGRWPYVVFIMRENPLSPTRGVFIEYETLEQAIQVHHSFLGKPLEDIRQKASSSPGFRRLVQCGYLTPWFYAVGNQELLGDFAIIPGWGNDPMYHIGMWYLVETEYGTRVKVCMGAHVAAPNQDSRLRRVVLWHDGTHWDGRGTPPRQCKHQPDGLALPPDPPTPSNP